MPVALPQGCHLFPSGDMVHADFALSLAGLSNETHALEIPIINNKSSIVAIARNNGVERAREFAADYVLFLDSDMVFPRTTLYRLLLHRKDIVGATYTKRVPPFTKLGTCLNQDIAPDAAGLVPMQTMPTGCLLIHMKVFAALTKPYFHFLHDEANGTIRGEDYVFCDRARSAGFEIWCDANLSQEIGHIGQQIYRIAAEP